MKSLALRAASLAMLAVLGGCAVGDYWDKWFGSSPALKPAELVAIKPTADVKLRWQGNVGKSDAYVFSPALSDDVIYAAGASGEITRFDLTTGKVLSRIDTKGRLSGGVGTDGRIVLVGTPKGEVVAFDREAKQLWRAQLSSEVLSAPQINSGVVAVRSGDGRIYGLDADNGARKWVYQRTLPPLTIRSHVGIVLYRNAVFAGFPGGRLVALSLNNGNMGWEATVAFPKGSTELERVTDISSLPVVDPKVVCAVAYQGRVTCIDILKGSTVWSRDISSVAGLAMEGRNVYVSDDKSAVVALDRSSGASVWKQDRLYGRSISGPAVVGNLVAVGDYQGYVHFLNVEDGSFAARLATDGSPIVAQPIAIKGGVLVQTRGGGVFVIAIQ